jgi:probable FeS assembly SUF system protein SufT
MSKEIIALKRECEATEIPSGRKMTFFSGTEVIVLQTLGGSYTVMTHMGQMASIAGKDADALGKTPPQEPAAAAPGEEQTTDKLVWAQLKTCYDPEIPHNIVDLGLVYDCKISPVNEADKKVDIKMTLTAPGCGMGEWLRQDVQKKVLTVAGVKECNVEVVFDPPWDRSMMHPALRREFG